MSKLFTQDFNSDIQKNIYKFLFDEVKKARIEEQRLQANKEKNSNDPVYEFIYNDMSDLEVAVMIARLRTLLDPSNGFLDNRQTPLSEDYLKNLRDLNSLEKVSAAIDVAINSADSSEAIKVLVVKRAWQITGEYLKSTDDSLLLSPQKSQTIDVLLRKQLKLISNLRNKLSHAKTLMHSDNVEYKNSVPELTKLHEVIKKLIYREKFKSIISLIANLPNITKSSDEIESAIDRDLKKISEGRQSNFMEVEGIIQSCSPPNQNEAKKNLILDSLNQLHINVIAHDIPKIEISGSAVEGDGVALRGRSGIRNPSRKTASVITISNMMLQFMDSHLKPEDKTYNAAKGILEERKSELERSGDFHGETLSREKEISDVEKSLKILEATKTIFNNKKSLMRFFTGKLPGVTEVKYKEYIKSIKDAVALLPESQEREGSKQALEILEGCYGQTSIGHRPPSNVGEGGNPIQDPIEQLNKISDPLTTLLDNKREKYEASPEILNFYKKTLLLSTDYTPLYNNFVIIENRIYIAHFNVQLTILKEILLEENSNVVDYLKKPQKANLVLKFEQNPQLNAALKFLLLDLNDTFLELEELYIRMQPEYKKGLEKILSGNEISLKKIRDYFAHGDDLKDLLNHDFPNMIIDNALQLIDKGEALINVMKNVENEEIESLEDAINDLIKKGTDDKMKSKYQDVLNSLDSLDSENSVPSQDSQASKNVMEVLKYEIAGSVLFDDQKNFQYLLDKYKAQSSEGSVNSAVDNLIYHNKRSILHLAAELGRERFIAIILRESRPLHSMTAEHGKLPIFSAASSGDLGSFNLLLAELDKINLQKMDDDLKTVLIYAVEGKNTDIVKALLKKAETLIPDDSERRSFIKSECDRFPLIFASDDPKSTEISSLLGIDHTDSSGKSAVAQPSTSSCSRNRRKRSGGCQQEGGVIRRLDAFSEQVQEVHKRIVEVNKKLIQDEISLQHSIVNDVAEHIANLESSIQTVKGELSRINSDLQRITQDLRSPSLIAEISTYLVTQENAELLRRNIEERINSIKSRAESSIYTVSVSLSGRADGLKNAIEVQKIVINHAQEVSTIRNALAGPSGATMSDDQFKSYRERTKEIVKEILAMGTTPGIKRSIDFQVEKLYQEMINYEVRSLSALWKDIEEGLNPEVLINYHGEKLDTIVKDKQDQIISADKKYAQLVLNVNSAGRSLVEDIDKRFKDGMDNINSKLQYFEQFVPIMKKFELFNVKKSAFYASIKSIELKEGSSGSNVVEKFISEARKFIADCEAVGMYFNFPAGRIPDFLVSKYEIFFNDIRRLKEITNSVADNDFSKPETLSYVRNYLNDIYDNPRVNAAVGATCSSRGSRGKRDTACSADKYIEELRKLSPAEQEKFAQRIQDSTFSGSKSKIKQAEKARNLLLSKTMTVAQRSYEMDELFKNPKVERFLSVSEGVSEDISQSKNPKFKQRLMNAAGGIQFIRGAHTIVVSCKNEGLSKNCALGAAEMGFSLFSHRIEQVMLKIMTKVTPQVAKSAAIVAGKVPGALGQQLKSGIQMVGAGRVAGRVAGGVARGGAGLITSVFDIVDFAQSAKELKNCLSERKEGEKPCSDKEIRDSAAGMVFSGIAVFSGVTFTILLMPGVGTVVGLILMVSQGVYSGISNVKEYKEKYDTTHSENLDIFFRSAALQPIPEDVQYLAAKTEIVNQLAKEVWKHLQNSTNVAAIAMGLGELTLKSYITLGRCKRNIGFDPGRTQLGSHAQRSRHPVCNVEKMAHNISPSHASIMMNETSADPTRLSRFTPQSPSSNAKVLCAPRFSTHGAKNIYNRYIGYENERYEYDDEGNFLPVFASQPTAIYPCGNAFVIANRTRIDNDDKKQTILYDLKYVDQGEVIGSNEWENAFLIQGGHPQVSGGNNTKNAFYVMGKDFSGRISGGNNATNILDFSDLNSPRVSYNLNGIYGLVSLFNHDVTSISHFITQGINWVIGAQNKHEDINCKNNDEIFINIRGGSDNNEKDILINCKKAVISPYTKAAGGDGNYVFYIKPNNILEAVGHSEIDVSGNGTLIFPETALLKDCRIIYSIGSNTLSFKIPLSQNKTFVLEVKNYLNKDKTPKFHLIDKHGSNIVPIIRESESKEDSVQIKSFRLNAEKEAFRGIQEDETWYESISQSHEDYQVFGIIEDKRSKQKRIFGNSETNILYMNGDVVFAQGGNGSDVYLEDGNVSSGRMRIDKIDNCAEDQEPDILLYQQHSLVADRIDDSLYLYRVPDENGLRLHKIIIKDYFKDPSYQHLMISTNEGIRVCLYLLN